VDAHGALVFGQEWRPSAMQRKTPADDPATAAIATPVVEVVV
jgi:hypothetical protein